MSGCPQPLLLLRQPSPRTVANQRRHKQPTDPQVMSCAYADTLDMSHFHRLPDRKGRSRDVGVLGFHPTNYKGALLLLSPHVEHA